MSNEKKNYGETLNLPKTDFPMRGNLPEREPFFLERMENMKVYEKALAKNKESGENFILHDGPPYANGNIHLGHAFNKILKDICIRYKTMQGYYAPYIPGWDTHGLPIEKKVQKELGVNKDEVGIPKFREICKNYALEQVNIQKEQFKRLGGLGDYDDENKRYLTLNPEFEAKQIEVFGDMYEKGYIYRDLKPVYWCQDCATALAEAEIEYENDTTTSIYVKFKVIDDKGLFEKEGDLNKIFFVIWTTTPWTIPGNQAVTVNKDFEYSMVKVNDEKYIMASDLVDTVMKEAEIENYEVVATYKGEEFENMWLKHPLLDKKSRVILGGDNDLIVTLDAGTGCVHTAPGFGHEDYLCCKRYGDIEIIVPVDEKGYMTEEAGEFAGMLYSDANGKVITRLDEENALLAAKKIEHPYPHCWRCHKPIIYRATTQWFASVDKFRQNALDAIKGVNWYPKWGEERMTNMVKDRTDWCVSRQRTWGVPIPILYCEDCGKEYINKDTIEAIARLVRINGSSIWYEMTAEQILKAVKGEHKCECGCTKYVKETDIMDVWFDSGTTHFSVLNDEKKGLMWPATLYLEGNDQYRGWFQSSLLTSVAVTGKAPYENVVTHGFLIDEEKRKMSKSAGNGINPQDVINKFGADILRFWTISSDYHTDVRVSNDILAQVAEVYKKIRNTSRFMLGNLYDFNPNTDYVEYENREELDKYIMYKANNLVKTVIDAYEGYDFHVVYNEVHRFASSELSSKYLDVVKDPLYTLKPNNSIRRAIQSTMYDVLNIIVKLISPVLSFTSEEIWSYMNHKSEDNEISVLLTTMPSYSEKYDDKELAEKWDKIYELREELLSDIEKARAEKKVGHPLDAIVTITVPEKDFEFMTSIKEILEMILIVSKVDVVKGEEKKVEVDKAPGYKCARCWKYNEDVGRDKHNPDICPKCIENIE